MTTACSESYCDRPTRARGLCRGHYKQFLKGGPLRPFHSTPRARVNPSVPAPGTVPCVVRGCGKLNVTKGFCGSHYQISRMYGVTPEQIAGVINLEVSCDLCGSQDRLVFDHDHRCCPDPRKLSKGKTCGNCLRGVLCTVCNTTLGLLKEDEAHIRRILAYIQPKAA